MDIITENKGLSIEEIKKKTDALQNKIKFQAFGKSKPPTAKSKQRRLEVSNICALKLDEEKARQRRLEQTNSSAWELDDENTRQRCLEGTNKSALELDAENEENKELLRRQSQIIENAINKLKSEKHGRVTNVHKMRSEIAGPKKTTTRRTCSKGS